MKYIILLVCLLGTGLMYAQVSKEEIVKFRVVKVTETVQMGESVYTNIYWYDRKGNDSLRIIDGKKVRITNVYKGGKLVSSEHLKEQGEPDKYEYAYDGSGYKLTYTDGEFGMKSHEWYNKAGKLIKSQSPDGNTTTFKLDSKGKQLGFESDGANKGIKVKRVNTYDVNGKLTISEYVRDGDSSTVIYTHDAKGKLIQEQEKGTSMGMSTEARITYEYNSRGLLSKQITHRKWGSDEEQETSEGFEYEYY